MNISIHRGANQIGGCITEISNENCKILIDLGRNLPGCKSEELTESDVRNITENVDAIFYTHCHSDHVGLFHLADPEIPQYIGCGAKDVMQCKYDRIGDDREIAAVKRMHTYIAGEKIDVAQKGQIYVTPYFVSHSAFDAYMFKIECEGKVILHTGDFRKHGYLGKGLFPTLEKLVGKVDILIIEGTMLDRGQEQVLDEVEIKRNTVDFLRTHKYVYALCSSTDMDRLASFHAACKESGRLFLADRYQKQVLDVFSAYSGKKSELFNFDRVFKIRDIKSAKVRRKLQKDGFLIPVRMSSATKIKEMLEIYSEEPAWLIYSMWNGYAEKDSEYCIDSVVEIRDLFGERIMDGSKDGFHTSGHADVNTLKAVCETVKPKIGIIPIHKDQNADFKTILNDESYKIFSEGEYNFENLKISVK